MLCVSRLGEFTVKVIVSNLISSASLSSYVFVVDRPCWPPPVKNMGPLKRQVQDVTPLQPHHTRRLFNRLVSKKLNLILVLSFRDMKLSIWV